MFNLLSYFVSTIHHSAAVDALAYTISYFWEIHAVAGEQQTLLICFLTDSLVSSPPFFLQLQHLLLCENVYHQNEPIFPF